MPRDPFIEFSVSCCNVASLYGGGNVVYSGSVQADGALLGISEVQHSKKGSVHFHKRFKLDYGAQSDPGCAPAFDFFSCLFLFEATFA